MTGRQSTRRQYLRRAGAAVAVAGACSLAGCPSPNQSVFDEIGEGTFGGSSGDAEPENPPPVTDEPDYGDWFDDVDNYENGTVVYRADRDSVSVAVGENADGQIGEVQSSGEQIGADQSSADQSSDDQSSGDQSSSGDTRGFHHPAIAVSVGTTVEWEWTGDGDAHNVVAVDETFDSGAPESTRSEPFRHQFTEPGTVRYRCENYGDDGMRGSVSVYEVDE